MARTGLFEQVVTLGDIVGTTDAINKVLWANKRPDGASLQLVYASLQGISTASATDYYTISLINAAGSTACSRTTAAVMTYTSQSTFGTVTAANAVIADGENLSATFAQTRSGMSISDCSILLQFKVIRDA